RARQHRAPRVRRRAGTGVARVSMKVHDRAMRRLAFLIFIVVGCGTSAPDDPTFPLPDGTPVPLPLECLVQPAGPAPYSVTFQFRNTGTRPVFLGIEYTCALRAGVSSCARNFEDNLMIQGGTRCTCDGGCAVGGPNCNPSGRLVAPGAQESLSWQA